MPINYVSYNSQGHKTEEVITEKKGRTRSTPFVTRKIIYHDLDDIKNWDWTQFRKGELVGGIEPRPNVVKEEGCINDEGNKIGLWTIYLFTGDIYQTDEYEDGIKKGLYTLYWRRQQDDKTIGPIAFPRKYIDCNVDNTDNQRIDRVYDYFIGDVRIYDSENKVKARQPSIDGNIFG